MHFIENIAQAFRNLRANVVRATLTLFIISLGIMALVGIFTAIDATIGSLTQNLSSLGANAIQIKPANSSRRDRDKKQGPPITYQEALVFEKKLKDQAVMAIGLNGTGSGTIQYQGEKTNPNVGVKGINEHFLELKGLEIEEGRNFVAGEIRQVGRQAIIGKEVVSKLFRDDAAKALGNSILVNGQKFNIIGVLKSKGSGFGNSQDNVVLIPLLTAKSIYGTSTKSYDLSVVSTKKLGNIRFEDIIVGYFRAVRKLRVSDPNDFEVVKDDTLEGILRENTASIQAGAIAIGALTLLGAAIGLMNIMMVSVTERTKEIGVSKALGATKRNILIQFLTEAVVICQIGGILGIILGILAGNIITVLLGGSFIMPWLWVGLGFTVCLFVGILSGIYPAIKASNLDPIESLRHA